MNRIALSAALALGLSSPAVADMTDRHAEIFSQLAAEQNETWVDPRSRVNPGMTDRAAEIFARLAAEDSETWVDPRDVVATQSFGISPGHAQVAASLGLNPEEYSLSELVTIKADRDDD